MMNRNALIFSICTVLLASCSAHKGTENQTQQGMLLTDSLRRVVSVDTVHNRPISDELTLNGKVDFNQKEVAPVIPMFGGVVTTIHGELGDYVTKGSVLAVIRSSDVADYGKQREEGQQQLILARRNLSATKDMFASGLASQKDVMSAKQDVANAMAELKRIHQIYSIYHLSSNAMYAIKAPVSGFIVQKNVNAQMQVQPDGPIFTISGLNNVWVVANVYESDISKVHQGMPVKITTLAYPDKEFSGKIEKVYNMLDEESKTMSVRISLSNRQYLLKPGMLANVYVEGNQKGEEMPCVDSHSLIFENGKNFVVVVADHNRLETREVEVTKQTSRHAFISSGLKEGDLVINKNALLVYNALDAQ